MVGLFPSDSPPASYDDKEWHRKYIDDDDDGCRMASMQDIPMTVKFPLPQTEQEEKKQLQLSLPPEAVPICNR